MVVSVVAEVAVAVVSAVAEVAVIVTTDMTITKSTFYPLPQKKKNTQSPPFTSTILYAKYALLLLLVIGLYCATF